MDLSIASAWGTHPVWLLTPCYRPETRSAQGRTRPNCPLTASRLRQDWHSSAPRPPLRFGRIPLRMADIFLSYAREDIAKARTISKQLEERGWKVFWDRRIPHGQDFNAYLQKQIDAAWCIVVLWSRAATASQFVRDEAAEGLNGRLYSCPDRIGETTTGIPSVRSSGLEQLGWRGYQRRVPGSY